MTVRTSARRGVALFAALIAIVLLVLLGLGAMHLSRDDFRRTRDEGVMRRAGNAADAGAYDLLRRWANTPHEGLAIGAMMGPDTLQLTGAFATSRTVRASLTTFWTVSTGQAGDSLAGTLARRAVQVSYRLALPGVLVNAALVARDSVTVAGGARVSGTDTTLAGWGASCAASAHTAGIAMPDTGRLCDGSCGGGSKSGAITGLPPLVADTTAADTARYRVFGRESWASLTGHAAIVVPGGSVITPAPALSGMRCDRTRSDNWGAPGSLSPCGTYAPLIWATGDIEMRGGVGQGVLLVDGDLTLSGGAEFVGLVITRDDLMTTGTGGTVLGGVLAGDAVVAPGDHTTLGAGSRVQRSRCGIEHALEWSARLIPVRQRSWAALR